MKNFGYKVLLAVLFTTLATTQITMPINPPPGPNVHIDLGGLEKTLKGLKLNINLGELLKGINLKSLGNLASLSKLPNLNIGNVLKGLSSLEDLQVKMPNIKSNFIGNIKSLTDLPNINIKDISSNLGSLAELTKLNIPVGTLGSLMQGGFNLKGLADRVKGMSTLEAKTLINNLKKGPKSMGADAKKAISLTKELTSMATTQNLEALLKLLNRDAKKLAEAAQMMTDKTIPAPIRKPLEKAFNLVFAQVKKLVNAELKAMTVAGNLTDLLNLVVQNEKDLVLIYATMIEETIPATLRKPLEKAFNKVVARIKKLIGKEVLGASELRKLLVSSSSSVITDNNIPEIVSLVGRVLDSANPKAIKEAVSTVRPKILKLIEGQIDRLDELKGTTVQVGTKLDEDEQEFIKKRRLITKGAIESLTGLKNLQPHELPTIAMCASGGGYRAMIGARGFFVGAEDIGLMDTTTYISCLSGGTWATWPYLLKKAKDKGFNTKDAQANLNDTTFPNSNPFLIDNIVKNTEKVRDIAANFFTKYFMNEPITFVDVYGILIGNALLSEMFGNNTYEQALHDMQAYSKTAESPLPIGTAIITNNRVKEWLEVSPFSAGSIYLNSYVSTETFGSRFDKCKITTVLPSQFAGYFLGTFGSAFALNSSDFLDESGLRTKLLDLPVVGGIIKRLDIPLTQKAVHQVAKRRPLAAELKNFSYNCTGKLKNAENLVMVDAGLAFNLPLPPLVDRKEREVDVICVIDMSGGLQNKKAPAGELLKAVKYFEKKGIPFPVKESDFKDKKINIGFEPCSVFKFSDAEMALLKRTGQRKNNLTVLYFPWCADISSCYDKGDKWCGTFNFNYTSDQVKELAGCMSGNVKKSEGKIKQAIIDSIKDKTKTA